MNRIVVLTQILKNKTGTQTAACVEGDDAVISGGEGGGWRRGVFQRGQSAFPLICEPRVAIRFVQFNGAAV